MLIDTRVLLKLVELYEKQREEEAAPYWSNTPFKLFGHLKTAVTFVTRQTPYDYDAKCKEISHAIVANKFSKDWLSLILQLGREARAAEKARTAGQSRFTRVLHAMRSYILCRILYDQVFLESEQKEQAELRTAVKNEIERLEILEASTKSNALLALGTDPNEQVAVQEYWDRQLDMVYLGNNSSELLLAPEKLASLLYRVEYPDQKLSEQPDLRMDMRDSEEARNPNYVCTGIPAIFHHKIYYKLYCRQVLFPETANREEAFTTLISKLTAEATCANQNGLFRPEQNESKMNNNGDHERLAIQPRR